MLFIAKFRSSLGIGRKIGAALILYILSIVVGVIIALCVPIGDEDLRVAIFAGVLSPSLICWLCVVSRYPVSSHGDDLPASFLIYVDGEQKGPFTASQLRSMWSSGTVTASALYWSEGMPDWKALSELCEKPIIQAQISYSAQTRFKSEKLIWARGVIRDSLIVANQCFPHRIQSLNTKVVSLLKWGQNIFERWATNLGVPRTYFFFLSVFLLLQVILTRQ